MKRTLAAMVALVCGAAASSALVADEAKVVRARDLGIPFDFGDPGPWNAITDVPGVEVGHVTLIEGDAVRTGVTAVLPRGKTSEPPKPCFAGVFSLNGAGEMTGSAWVEESGFLDSPVLLTNTNSIGAAHEAAIRYARQHWPVSGSGWTVWSTPVVAETWDGTLNDIYGMHVRTEHVFRALDDAASGPVAEGGVGGGTGMTCYDFKGGIGTASRALPAEAGGYVVGVLVQANHGSRHQLRIGGLPLGRLLGDIPPAASGPSSIIIVVATNAPLLPHQLKRLARRAALGLARTGAVAEENSGDLFIAFSTANPRAGDPGGLLSLSMLPNDRMSPLFEATVGATEEAVVNALVAGRTMTGRAGHRVIGLPHDEVRAILERHGIGPARAPR